MNIFKKRALFNCSLFELSSLLLNQEFNSLVGHTSARLLDIKGRQPRDGYSIQIVCGNPLIHSHVITLRAESSAQDSQTLLEEKISYSLPFGGSLFQPGEERYERAFEFKKRMIDFYLSFNTMALQRKTTSSSQKILISGASGLVGKSLVGWLRTFGHTPLLLVRKTPQISHEIFWDPQAGIAPQIDSVQDIDHIICLSGASIAERRWTYKRKQELLKSRINPVKMLLGLIPSMKTPPRSFSIATGIGIYTPSNERISHESIMTRSSSFFNTGFLGELAESLESMLFETSDIVPATRKIAYRIAPILSSEGGMLKKLLPIFKLGLGGSWGSPDTSFSWICLEDAVAAIIFSQLLTHLEGPINISSPIPSSPHQFATELAALVRRPSFFHIPRPAMSLFLGKEQADELLFYPHNIYPQKLLEAEFHFSFDSIQRALHHLINK